MSEWKLSLLGLLSCLYMAAAADGPMCYSCDRVSQLSDCKDIQQCGPHQECFVQRVLGTNLAEFFKLGCIDAPVCQSQFSFYGFNVGKRDMSPAHPPSPQIRKRLSDTDMVMCLQCCNGSFCNYNDGLCGAPPTQNRRCFRCKDVTEPHECDSITECGSAEECFVHKYHAASNHQLRFELGCQPVLLCNTLAAQTSGRRIGCIKCCNHSDYCNYNACDDWKDTYNMTTTGLKVPTTHIVMPTRPPTTPKPAPTPVITGNPKIPLGGMLDMNCRVSETVKAIRWNFNSSTMLPPGAFAGTNGHLIVNPLTPSNTGTYTCVIVATNGQISSLSTEVGLPQTPIHVVNVTRSPSQRLSPGESFHIDCVVTGNPPPNQVVWTFTDLTGIKIIPSNVDYSADKLRLTVSSYAGTFHDGKWTCYASNSLGGDSDDLNIP